jgi:hypothetical protein
MCLELPWGLIVEVFTLAIVVFRLPSINAIGIVIFIIIAVGHQFQHHHHLISAIHHVDFCHIRR